MRMEDETKTTEAVLVGKEDGPRSLVLAGLADEAREHIRQSKSENTRRAYKSDWADFTAWCADHKRASMPALPETVALYLSDRAHPLKPSPLQRRMATIAQAHQVAGYESPTKHSTVRAVWQGIRRSKGVATKGKEPAVTSLIRAMVAHLPEGRLLSTRDRALLLLGFAGAMRRSELVGLDVQDISENEDGLIITIRWSKTDQEGQGEKVGIPYGSHRETCPVRSVKAWLRDAGITEGALFRAVNIRHGQIQPEGLSDRTVARVVKRALLATGKECENFAGHSLRAGLATAAAQAGVNERAIQNQTRHKSLLVLRRYIRDGSLFRENAAAKVGL